MVQRYTENVQHQLPDTRQRVKEILDNVDSEDYDVQVALSSISMDDAPNVLRNDVGAAVTLLLPFNPVITIANV